MSDETNPSASPIAVKPDFELIRKKKAEEGRKASEAAHKEYSDKAHEFYRTGDPTYDKAQDDARDARTLQATQLRQRQAAEAKLQILNPEAYPELGGIATLEHELDVDLKTLNHLTRKLVDPLDGKEYEVSGATTARRSFLRKHSMSDQGTAAEVRERVKATEGLPGALRDFLVDREVLGEAEAAKALQARGFGVDQLPL